MTCTSRIKDEDDNFWMGGEKGEGEGEEEDKNQQ